MNASIKLKQQVNEGFAPIFVYKYNYENNYKHFNDIACLVANAGR